jgi:pimeloyl-ACP methyl ester carboxylesterase
VPTQSRSRFVLPLVVVAGLVLAACGGDEGGSGADTTAAPSDSAAATTAAPDTTAAPTTAAAPTTIDESPSTIDWQPCTDIESSAPLECATVQVPLDYDDPAGEQIDIAMSRLAAVDPSRREGAILFNPGGPGASGRDLTEAVGSLLGGAAPELAERFDLIGFDPRGVGASNPVRCVDDAWKDRYVLADASPDNAVEEADAAESTLFGAYCQEQLGAALSEYSTNNTARDIDRIREALGDEQISFYGISYGTLLGATYGGLFPDRVRVLVLDSAFSPELPGESPLVTQVRGLQASFDDWAEDCAADAACPFTAASVADVTARWQALGDTLDTSPLDVGGRPVNREVLAWGTLAALYDPRAWSVLSQALADAEQGDATVVQALADSYFSRNPDGTYGNDLDAQAVINCASDVVEDPSLGPSPEELQAISPVFGLALGGTTGNDVAFCDTVAVEPRASIAFLGNAPVIVIGGTGDPATPFAMAEQMVADIGPQATLIVFEGEGHGQSLGDPCLLDVVTRALLTATAPAAGTVCTQQT